MKVSKKSLLMSIAVLCVCAISLTAASYAWFSATESAKVDSLTLSVDAQSDIKIAINPEALNSAESAYWVTTLNTAAITGYAGDDFVGDVTTAPLGGTWDGENFLAPTEEARERVLADGSIADFQDADLVAAQSGEGSFYKFTIYVRTTGNAKGVTYSSTGFKMADESLDKTKTALAAMRLGDSGAANITKGETASGVVKFVEATALENTWNDGYYTTSVTFYIWVEGTDAACKNSNAASVYDYVNTINFGYEA